MEFSASGSFNSLVERFLGTPLPPRLAGNNSFSSLLPDARAFIGRMLVLMKRASFPVTDFNAHMIRLLFVVNPAMLPSAWGGRIPPLTSRGRHSKLDRYVVRQAGRPGSGPPVFVDLGCGFPPATTVDTAKSMPDWLVYGVEPSFACYTLYDAEGNYACFTREGGFLYSQTVKHPLNDRPEIIREKFEALFAELSPRVKALSDRDSETVEQGGNRLVFNHVRDFEARNLKFIETDIDGLQLPPARVVRCMNVLLYFEKRVRQEMRQRIGAALDHGGLLISGFNHPYGIYGRYAVAEKGANGMTAREFAFSMDNLRPLGIGPWVTIQDRDEDAELLADLTGAIRADRRFWPDFNRRVDVLQSTYGICRRDDDGFIQFTEEARTAPPGSILEKTTALWNQLEAEGYADGAVGALARAGYQAWKNPVGDIAVSPTEGAAFTAFPE